MSWDRTDKDEILSEGRPRRGRGRIRLLAAIVVLALVAWYLLGRDEAPGPGDQGSDWAVDDAGPADIAPIEREPFAAGPAREGDEARAMIAELRATPGTGPSRAYARAEAFRDSGRLADAYLLYFYAARQGHAASALALGTMADPEFHSQADSFLDEPDELQARKWYQVAAEQGDETARRRLAVLEQRVEAAAATGDERARRLLLQWR
jgi:TPR repeat protein